MHKFVYLSIALFLVMVASMIFHRNLGESFENVPSIEVANACPTEAIRGPDGSIRVNPGNRTFKTLSDYVGYLSGLYAKGSMCIPPKVMPNRSPIDGLLGGLGNGAQPPETVALEGTTRNVMDSTIDEQTSARTPVNKLDDYEYTRVFETERGGRNTLSKASKNELLENRILDWAALPFNSEERARNEDEFIAGRMRDGFQEPKSGIFFNNVEGKTLEPPDIDAKKAREQKILSSYQPTDISKHVMDSQTEVVANIVNKMYAEDKSWEPVVTQVGENQWEVTELRPKPRKERFAQEATQELSMMEAKELVVPPPVVDIDDRIRGDPYFDKSGVGDRDNNRLWNYKEFNKWTPGLERMFAPTADNKAWY